MSTDSQADHAHTSSSHPTVKVRVRNTFLDFENEADPTGCKTNVRRAVSCGYLSDRSGGSDVLGQSDSSDERLVSSFIWSSSASGNSESAASTADQFPTDIIVTKTKIVFCYSAGSRGHADKTCNPCLFFIRGICGKGEACAFCHLRHRGLQKKRIKPSKRTREKLKAANKTVSAVGEKSVGASNCDDDDASKQTREDVVILPSLTHHGKIRL